MDKIARIRQKIKELQDEFISIQPKDCSLELIKSYAGYAYLDKVLSFLDTLSEEPDKSLEEAAEEAATGLNLGSHLRFIEGFKAGAEWQKEQDMDEWIKDREGCFWDGVEEGKKAMEEQMLKDAVEGYVNYYEDSGGILMAEAQVGCPYHNGDKVRIVVLKEEE